MITTFNILFWCLIWASKFVGLLSVSISTYGNCIALFQNGYFSLAKGCQTGDFYLWVMEEYGVVSSWTKVLKIGEGLPRPIGFKRNGEVVLLSYHMMGNSYRGFLGAQSSSILILLDMRILLLIVMLRV